MTTNISIGLFVIIILAIGADMMTNTGATLFLMRRLYDLIGVVAFWQ